MMSGIGDDHQGLTANLGYHKMRSTIQGQEMLIMGKGEGLLLNNFIYGACYLLEGIPLKKNKQ